MYSVQSFSDLFDFLLHAWLLTGCFYTNPPVMVSPEALVLDCLEECDYWRGFYLFDLRGSDWFLSGLLLPLLSAVI